MSAPTDDAVGRVAKELDRQRSWGGMAWVDAPRVSVPTDALRALLARVAECEADAQARQWECWVNVYPDGEVYPYTSETKARQMLSKLTGAETVRVRMVEIRPLDHAMRGGA